MPFAECLATGKGATPRAADEPMSRWIFWIALHRASSCDDASAEIRG